MATRIRITKALAVRYQMGWRALKPQILDTACAVTGYHRDYARRALRLALTPQVVKPRARRPLKYRREVVEASRNCWVEANAPADRRLAPLLVELVPVRVRRNQELDIDDDSAALLISMSAATIDRQACWGHRSTRSTCVRKPNDNRRTPHIERRMTRYVP